MYVNARKAAQMEWLNRPLDERTCMPIFGKALHSLSGFSQGTLDSAGKGQHARKQAAGYNMGGSLCPAPLAVRLKKEHAIHRHRM